MANIPNVFVTRAGLSCEYDHMVSPKSKAAIRRLNADTRTGKLRTYRSRFRPRLAAEYLRFCSALALKNLGIRPARVREELLKGEA